MPFRSDTYIRRAERDDLDVVVAWMQEPDFQRFLYGDPVRSPKKMREQIVGMLGRTAGHAMPTAIYLMIDSKEDGSVGLLSVQNLSWRNRSCNVDLYIGEEKMRNRFTTALAVTRSFEYCFHELNLHRVGAFIYAFNKPSWRLFERMGAVRELTLRDHVARDGKLHDMYGYGLLRHEFEATLERYGRVADDFSLRAMIESLAKDGPGSEQ